MRPQRSLPGGPPPSLFRGCDVFQRGWGGVLQVARGPPPPRNTAFGLPGGRPPSSMCVVTFSDRFLPVVCPCCARLSPFTGVGSPQEAESKVRSAGPPCPRRGVAHMNLDSRRRRRIRPQANCLRDSEAFPRPGSTLLPDERSDTDNWSTLMHKRAKSAEKGQHGAWSDRKHHLRHGKH